MQIVYTFRDEVYPNSGSLCGRTMKTGTCHRDYQAATGYDFPSLDCPVYDLVANN